MPRRHVDAPRIPPEQRELREPKFPWDNWDWSGDAYDFCDCEGCEMCDLQREWWAQLSPYMPFEENGIVHITRATDYTAVCGWTRLDKHFRDSQEVLMRCKVARDQHKAITCIECLAAWKPEASSFL